MTDVVLPGARTVARPSEEAARALVRRRYRTEARFRAYGLGAILFAALAVVVLVADIVSKALPAFTVSELVLPVEASPEALDVAPAADAAALAGANFVAPIRQTLLGYYPEVRDQRRLRSQLYGLLSSDAGMGLRRALTADPAALGSTLTVPALLSDDADLFYKGYVTEVTTERTNGIGTPSGVSGTVTVFSAANDFANELVAIKNALAGRARELTRQREDFAERLATLQPALESARQAAAAVPDDAGLAGIAAKLDSDRTSLDGTIAGLDAQIADLQQRAQGAGTSEVIDAQVPSVLVAINGGVVKATEVHNDRIVGETLVPLQSAADAAPGTWEVLRYDRPEAARKLSDQEVTWLRGLEARGLVSQRLNWMFLTSGDSREAELAGILGALVGSALTMLVTLAICLPVGVAAAIYLEEFAPKNRWTEIIEVNINNLAAVPSIVFGLLGLAVFLNFFGMPRSAPLVGGCVLALLVMPTIIIASRAALKAVPPSIREGALGVGASHQQAVFHHVLPLAMPGVLTGTIIGMAHALGETAPLLLIGMVAFIVDVPTGVTQAATVLPVQIFLWSDLPEIGFQAKTSAAIIVLLLFLFLMNGIAILLRKRFERRW
ncbi:phosphate transport system permease protein [Prosthecomicrobium pneumaticum]|uniref:Phosphate transport system permease protein PstA n=1 Tax=Prosthecomicrobium pneumaticum TaxID=81895 RepID=A0A7W9FMC3_9HYPH|nr:phosphate transport system permease protein [Prosthecomicrobium pneumaticum]